LRPVVNHYKRINIHPAQNVQKEGGGYLIDTVLMEDMATFDEFAALGARLVIREADKTSIRVSRAVLGRTALAEHKDASGGFQVLLSGNGELGRTEQGGEQRHIFVCGFLYTISNRPTRTSTERKKKKLKLTSVNKLGVVSIG
jgi:hypothetical protein